MTENSAFPPLEWDGFMCGRDALCDSTQRILLNQEPENKAKIKELEEIRLVELLLSSHFSPPCLSTGMTPRY